jgi:hypothetical protein
MPSLASCHRCQGFVADVSNPCPHCDAPPPRWRRVARVLASAVLGSVSLMTLMACYGATSLPGEDCYTSADPAACQCQQYGDCTECVVDLDCLQGEYCRDDLYPASCEWSGTCSDDTQCPPEMVCDPSRATCTPGVRPGCTSHDDCFTPSERCDFETRACVPTTVCGAGLPGCDEGFACDWSFSICVPCDEESCGSCVGEIECTTPPPLCPEDAQPAIGEDGCYTGGCVTDATCAAAACAILDELACDASPDCSPVYGGVNCSNPDGQPCGGGGACTCESYVFVDCVVEPPTVPEA